MAERARLVVLDNGYIYIPEGDLSDDMRAHIRHEFDRWLSGRIDGQKGILVLPSPAEVIDMREQS